MYERVANKINAFRPQLKMQTNIANCLKISQLGSVFDITKNRETLYGYLERASRKLGFKHSHLGLQKK